MNRHLTIKQSFWPAFAILILVIYGIAYHISSSEFWPITVSKTWWTPSAFELSQLQKPLFTLLLATLHLLPLGDVTHLYLAKILFSLLGALSLYYYVKNTSLIAKVDLSPRIEAILLVILVALSPVILHNFFRIRSDQLTFLFAMLAVHSALKKRPLKSLLTTLLIPLISIKSILLLLPLSFILWPHFRKYFGNISKIWKLNVVLAMSAALAWIIGMNLSSLLYLLDSYNSAYPSLYLQNYVHQEFSWILLSVIAIVFSFVKMHADLRPFSAAAIASVLLILIIPQSHPYYIATLAPFLYWPLIIFVSRQLYSERSAHSKRHYATALVMLSIFQFSVLAYSGQQNRLSWIHRNNEQFVYINKASALFEKHPDWNYLDGMGILPTRRFIRCFVSPYDDQSNNSCRQSLHSNPEPDVIIITQRLSSLGNDIFQQVESDYIQMIPNFWVHKRHQAEISDRDIELLNIPLPVLIFNF